MTNEELGWKCPVCGEWCRSKDIVCPFCAVQIIKREERFFKLLKNYKEIKADE